MGEPRMFVSKPSAWSCHGCRYQLALFELVIDRGDLSTRIRFCPSCWKNLLRVAKEVDRKPKRSIFDERVTEGENHE